MNQTRLKCVLVGDFEVGKTSLVQRITNNLFYPYYVPTIGIDFNIKEYKLGNKYYSVHLWDVSARNKYESLPTFCKDANIVWFCFDLSKPETLKSLENKRKLVDPKIFCVLVGCKCDKSIMTQNEIEQFLFKEGFDNYFITGSKQNLNVNELFEMSLLQPRIEVYKPENLDDTVPFFKKKKKKSCCFPWLKKSA